MIKEFGGLVLMALFTVVQADTRKVELFTTDLKTPIGSIIFTDVPYGLLISPHLSALKPGLHGIHIHQNPSCEEQGMAAGGHLDPKKTDKHLGPYGEGHLGDLPALYVDNNGNANHTMLAPRLKLSDLKKRSVMVHSGGDNYSDKPLPLGGGGARFACGVF